MTVDNNIHQKIKKNSEAKIKANNKYNAKTYKHK